MDLNGIVIFGHVVEAGSFTRAAKKLGMPKSTVSRKVSELEERMGARLLQRTTRQLHLTDVGRTVYQHAARIAEEMKEAELAVERMQGKPQGRLRVSVPLNFGVVIGRLAADLIERYPLLSIEVECTDRLVNLVEEGFDVALRAGNLADSSLIARRLTSTHMQLMASSAYLERHGEPKRPEELDGHACLVFTAPKDAPLWRLESDGRTAEVRASGPLAANDLETLKEAAVAGLGITLLPGVQAVAEQKRNRLVPVLPQWRTREAFVHVVYPSTRHLSPNVRVFIDQLTERMNPEVWADILARR